METRRQFVRSTAIGAALALQAIPVLADIYPSKPIRLVVPYPPGGGSDTFARIIAPRLSDVLGQQFLVDNRPGAATIIGADLVAKSAADGYTLLLGDNSTYAVNPSLYPKLPYAPLIDFSPITLTARFALVLVVNPTVPVKTVDEFVQYVKSKPGEINYGSPGAGSPHHLAMELFAQRAGIKLSHVAYKGGAPATQDLLGGTIPTMMLDFATAYQHIQAGKIRAIAVAGDKRIDQLKSVPTIAESGFPGYEAWAWQGIVAPARTPAAVIARLNTELSRIAADPEVQKRMVDIGGEFKPSSPDAMRAYMRTETDKWARIVKEANITVQ